MLNQLTSILTSPRRQIISLVLLAFLALTAVAVSDEFDEVEKTLGAKGEVKEAALVIRFPRTDIRVAIQGRPLPTSLGLSSWTAWKNMGDSTLVVGCLVLLEDEVNPVISELKEGGINVAGLTNRFLWEQPRVVVMGFGGSGKGSELARRLKAALSKTATPRQVGYGLAQAPVSLDTRRIEQITGYSGANVGDAFKITVGRSGVMAQGMEITSAMGLHSWAGFAGSDEQAFVTGAMAMTAGEIRGVVRSLNNGGVNVVGIHNFLLDEQPRIFLLYYWGAGRSENLAQSVRSALDQIRGPIH
jgi:hypothetical protein